MIRSTIFITALFWAALSAAQESVPTRTSVGFGEVYLEESFDDWQKLCVKTDRDVDPCHLYQLVTDENGHPTLEISIVRIEGQEGIAAGATIITPLETLLTHRLVLKLDLVGQSDFPYSWCDQRGCYVRIALSDDDVLTMKEGDAGTIEIRSVTAPDQPVLLLMSYLGFTAGFSSL